MDVIDLGDLAYGSTAEAA